MSLDWPEMMERRAPCNHLRHGIVIVPVCVRLPDAMVRCFYYFIIVPLVAHSAWALFIIHSGGGGRYSRQSANTPFAVVSPKSFMTTISSPPCRTVITAEGRTDGAHVCCLWQRKKKSIWPNLYCWSIKWELTFRVNFYGTDEQNPNTLCLPSHVIHLSRGRQQQRVSKPSSLLLLLRNRRRRALPHHNNNDPETKEIDRIRGIWIGLAGWLNLWAILGVFVGEWSPIKLELRSGEWAIEAARPSRRGIKLEWTFPQKRAIKSPFNF